ncbi:MAG TPA: PH domain-containing protein [Sphingomicrobium sp.]|nr:PH domain-containing protein [Sphingomicrobium sp.]
MSTDDRAVGEPERLHPLFLLTGLGRSLRGMAGGYAFIGYLAVSGRASTALIAAVVLLAFLAASLFVYWTRFEFRVGSSEIRVDSGIFSRTHRSIPFDRIQDVDISQGPVARLLDIAKVKFETGGSAGAGEDEGVLHAIPLERAQELRALVRSRRSAADEPVPTTAEAERPPVFAMDLPRVLLAGVFNFSLALFAGLIGATQTFGEMLGFDPLSRSFWLGLLRAGDPIADYILAHRVAAAFAGAVLLVLIGLATGIVRTLLREYGFRLDRTEVGLRRRRGLLTRTDVTLPARRAQAAIVGTGPLRDSLGWRDLKLQSLASDDGGGGDHVVAPLATDEEAGAILAELGWRPLSGTTDWKRVSSVYVWTLAIGLSPLLLAAALASTQAPNSAVAIAVLLALLVIRWRGWRRTLYALDGDRLLIRSGWWRRRTVILPLARIQSIDLTESFVSRWFGIAGLAFGVAGGSGFSEHSIPALPRETARALRKRLLVMEP